MFKKVILVGMLALVSNLYAASAPVVCNLSAGTMNGDKQFNMSLGKDFGSAHTLMPDKNNLVSMSCTFSSTSTKLGIAWEVTNKSQVKCGGNYSQCSKIWKCTYQPTTNFSWGANATDGVKVKFKQC